MAGVVVIVVVRIVHIVRLFPLLISLSCRSISICKVAIGREKAMLMGIDNDVILIVEIVSKRDTTRRTEVSRH